jgi:D-alanyl-lipoteichoic acid acyltransferase DltB (MBOAT superfamily)
MNSAAADGPEIRPWRAILPPHLTPPQSKTKTKNENYERFFFKYLIFFTENTIGLFNIFDVKLDPIMLKIILPLGISFYTFQTLSYSIDIYNGKINANKDIISFFAFV